MISDEVKDIALKIGFFYLEKNENDYAACEKEIRSLEVSKIEIEGEKLKITLGRPGILIGKYGVNIDNLQKYLGDQYKLHIHEDTEQITALMIPYAPSDYDEFDRVMDRAFYHELYKDSDIPDPLDDPYDIRD